MSRRLVVALSLACVRLGASLRVLRAQRRVLLRSSSVEDAEPAAVATESSRQRLPRVPNSTADLVGAAARNLKAAIAGGATRLQIDVFLPLLPTVKPEDLDPWPGGLRQMLGTALPIARAILAEAVPGGRGVSERDLSAEDSVVQLICEGEQPTDDAMMVVFASAETVDALLALDEACGARPLVLFNCQFSRPADLGFFRRRDPKALALWGAQQDSLEGRFPLAYSCCELSVRGEDVKLVLEPQLGWRAFVTADNVFEGQNLIESGTPIPLHEGVLAARPDYAQLEEMVQQVLPVPIYLRKLRQAGAKSGN